ncbi:agamous-like MADS-box protein AGL80 [Chenopodium quinoa]|uniref:agamous-like MADS-box protein AGL80 n=1 Tax=Chenopodium quinoa TaxID=63459 RepID=UPI000B798215|nr:agamous-like MADS-box protein AGL80 [Chenopodium quinoa]
MGRKKVKLAFIENASSRRVSHTKRSHGLAKKTQEMSVLCDVDACAIIYGKDEQVPVVWPSSETEVRRIINNYKSKYGIGQSSERQLDQQLLLNQTVKKTQEKLARIQRKNRELQMENMATDIMTGKSTLDQVAPNDLGDLIWVLEDRMKAIKYRICNWENNSNNPHFLNPNANHGDGMMEASTSRNCHTSG